MCRYVARRPVRSRLLAVRAERIAAERSGGGCTTDDDALSELRLTGKFCPRSERRQQLERQRQRRAEELVRLKNLSLEATPAAPNSTRRLATEPTVELRSIYSPAVGEAATNIATASPGRPSGRSAYNGGVGMTNSPSCGEFQHHSRQQQDVAANGSATRWPQDGGGGSAAEKRYSYHEESYSHTPNDILVSVMTV